MQAVSAEQFRYLFFRYGYFPNADQVMNVLSWLWRTYLGFGVILGLIGGVYLFKKRRGLLAGWIALTLPYTYFFTCYGAVDRDTMFGPTYLAWAVLLAFGLRTLFSGAPDLLRLSVTVGLPLMALVTNFSAVDRSTDVSVRTHAEDVLHSLPPNAVVAGYWADITPLQYLQFVENLRPDVKIYDLFMFRPSTFRSYVRRLSQSERRPLFLLNSAILSLPNTTDYRIRISPILTYLPGDSRQFLTVTLINRVSG